MTGRLINRRLIYVLTMATTLLASTNVALASGSGTTIERTPIPAQEASTPTPSAEIEASPSIGGEGYTLLPSGESGSLSVVAQGTYDGNILPIIVRNNTTETIYDVEALAIARDTSGALIATGADQEFRPATVPSGGITLGYIYLDGVALPSNTAFEFELSAAEPESDIPYFADLAIDEANFLSDRVVGIASNSNDFTVTGPIGIYLACLSEDGSISNFERTFADKDTVDPDGLIPFQVPLTGGSDCTNFLVTLDGYS